MQCKVFPFLILVVVSFIARAVSAQEEVTKVDVILKSIDTTARIVVVEHNGKISQLDLSSRATITINDKPVEPTALTPGDEATVEYHKGLAVVTKIAAKGNVKQTWQFFDVFAKGVKPEQAYIVGQDGRIVCLGKMQGYCLATLSPLSEFEFKIEFMLPEGAKGAAPFVAVSSSKPNPKGKDWIQQSPFGIEVKLNPEAIGEITLPKENFKAELPLGQLRDGRKVVSLRKPELKTGDWNLLEVACDKHNNVTVKINGTTVNAIAKAENTKGHIVIFPQKSEIQFRSPILVIADVEQPLPFSSIVLE
jgi:hypothetical protein